MTDTGSDLRRLLSEGERAIQPFVVSITSRSGHFDAAASGSDAVAATTDSDTQPQDPHKLLFDAINGHGAPRPLGAE